jgi:hypothetical protein
VGNIEACRTREGCKTVLERTYASGSTTAYRRFAGYRIFGGYKILGNIDAENKIDVESNQKENTDEYHLR